MENAKPKKVNAMGLVAIFSLYFVSMGITVVTPAMAKFAAAFPNQNITLISTLPTLFVVIGTFAAGAIAGKKISYKVLTILGSLLFLIGGCAPAMLNNFSTILVCRAITGFGIGLLAPLGNALVVGNFEGQKQASFLGYGTLFMNAGGIVLQMLGGVLADIDWHMTFWGHIVAVVALILAFFLPEPEKEERLEGAPAVKKEKIGSMVYVISIIFLLYNLLNYPVMLNMSILFQQRNAGGATAAATALSLFTVAGVLAGLVYGTIFKAAKRFCISIGFILSMVGDLLVLFGTSGVVMTIGLMCIGFGFSVIMPTFMAWIGLVTPPSTIAFAISVAVALMNLGGFLSSYWLDVLNAVAHEVVLSAITSSAVVFGVFGVIFLFINPFKERAHSDQ